jgi:hypothetical protein
MPASKPPLKPTFAQLFKTDLVNIAFSVWPNRINSSVSAAYVNVNPVYVTLINVTLVNVTL